MKHLVGTLHGVWVSRIEHLENIMNHIAERCKFTVVNRAFHQFEPFGATGVLVLSESHFSAHTYPEKNCIYLDVFCCSPHFDSDDCIRIIEEEFSSLTADWKVLERV